MKITIETPAGFGDQVWFMMGTEITCGVLCGFHYMDGQELQLQIFVHEDAPILSLPKSQVFPSRQGLVDFMLNRLLDSEVKLDI